MEGIQSRKKVAKKLLDRKPNYEPGSKFVYSNIGYGILGSIVEKFLNKSYDKIIDEHIFYDLDIKADYKLYYTDIGYAEGHKNNDLLVKEVELTPLKQNEHINPRFIEPAGEVYINISDSVKYLQQYLCAYYNKKSLFNKQIYDEQTKPIIDIYALGWTNTGTVLKHTGSYFCTDTGYKIYMDNNIGIVININSYQFIAKTITDKFIELFELYE